MAFLLKTFNVKKIQSAGQLEIHQIFWPVRLLFGIFGDFLLSIFLIYWKLGAIAPPPALRELRLWMSEYGGCFHTPSLSLWQIINV